MSAVITAALLLLLVLLPSPAPTLTLMDQTGLEVTLPVPPRRIVSLVPSVTEVLFAIAAQDLLVGVTDFCDYPPEARRKPSVGGMVAPNLETILMLKPDVVIATTAGNREETVVQLQRLRIPVYLVNPTTMGDVMDLIARLGALTEHRMPAARLVTTLDTRIQTVVGRVTPLGRPRVLYVLWPEPVIVPGRGALVSELIALAGGDSVTADGAEGYPRYSLEAAVARAPQVIILADRGAGLDTLAREKWGRLRSLPAIKAERLFSVVADPLKKNGPRVVDGLELLARLIHPEAFKK